MSGFWGDLSARERILLGAAAALIVLVGGFYGVVSPLLSAKADAEAAWRRSGDLLAGVERDAARARGVILSGGAPKLAPGVRNLRNAAGEGARNTGLEIARLQPEGEDAVRVWVENAPATEVYEWIIRLRNDYGLYVRSASISARNASGEVSAEVTLAAGAY